MSVFHWLCKFGLDVLLGIDVKKYKNSIGLWHTILQIFMEDLKILLSLR